MTVPFEVEIVQEVSIAPSSPSPFSSELFAQAVRAFLSVRALFNKVQKKHHLKDGVYCYWLRLQGSTATLFVLLGI